MSWLVACVVVRLGLDGADSLEYSPASEWIYLAVAVLALSIGIGGTILVVRHFKNGAGSRGHQSR